MATTNITIRMETDFIKQLVRKQKLPFAISRVYNPETIKALEDARNGISLSCAFPLSRN